MLLEEMLLPPNEAQVEAIKEDLSEDSGRFANNLELFEKWVQCQPHMPKKYEKKMLSVFLRGCKHDMEEAKRKVQSFLLCRSNMPEFFEAKEFNNQEQKVADNYVIVILPRLTDEGYRVSYFTNISPDLDLFDVGPIANITWHFGNIRACREHMYAGDVFILDAKSFTPAHASKLLNPVLKKTIMLAQEAFPFRIKAIYIINAPGYIEKIVNVVKMFFKEKLRNRIHIDQGTDILKRISEKCLPQDFGGTGPSINELDQQCRDFLPANKAWFEEQRAVKLTGDIPKTLTQSCTFEDDSVQGSFRQLSID